MLFSDYSYLALPEKNIKLVVIDLLMEAGIGLLSVKDGELEEVIPAKKSDECEYYYKYIHTSVIFDKYKKNNSNYIRKKDNIYTKFLSECNF